MKNVKEKETLLRNYKTSLIINNNYVEKNDLKMLFDTRKNNFNSSNNEISVAADNYNSQAHKVN